MLDSADLAAIREIVAEVALPPEFIDADGLGFMLAMSRAAVYKANDRGIVPAPVVIDVRGLRWRRREIVAWVDVGCPTRVTWEAIRGTAMKRVGTLPVIDGLVPFVA
jgi:predicted DNA-binding transcriptional regulator AlpA